MSGRLMRHRVPVVLASVAVAAGSVLAAAPAAVASAPQVTIATPVVTGDDVSIAWSVNRKSRSIASVSCALNGDRLASCGVLQPGTARVTSYALNLTDVDWGTATFVVTVTRTDGGRTTATSNIEVRPCMEDFTYDTFVADARLTGELGTPDNLTFYGRSDEACGSATTTKRFSVVKAESAESAAAACTELSLRSPVSLRLSYQEAPEDHWLCTDGD